MSKKKLLAVEPTKKKPLDPRLKGLLRVFMFISLSVLVIFVIPHELYGPMVLSYVSLVILSLTVDGDAVRRSGFTHILLAVLIGLVLIVLFGAEYAMASIYLLITVALYSVITAYVRAYRRAAKKRARCIAKALRKKSKRDAKLTTRFEVTELFFVRVDGTPMESSSKTWTTTNENDFTHLTHVDTAAVGEDSYDRDGTRVVIYRYES